MKDPLGFFQDKSILRAFSKYLQQIAKEHPYSTREINAVHFMVNEREVEKFPFYAAMAILSVKVNHPSVAIIVFAQSEPYGLYWDIISNQIDILFVQIPDFRWFGPASVKYVDQRQNIVRILALSIIGGLALTCDTFTLRNMDCLAKSSFVLAPHSGVFGCASRFGNTVLFSQPKSYLSSAWLRAYYSFDSNGGTFIEEFFASQVPRQLYLSRPEEVKILRHYQWFFPPAHRAENFIFGNQRIDELFELMSDQYVLPLWKEETGRMLEAWSPILLHKRDCVYARLCLKTLDSFPEIQRRIFENGRLFSELRETH